MRRHGLRALLALCLAGRASQEALAADPLCQRCEALLAQASVQVVFEDPPFTRDDAQDVQALRRLSQRA